MNLPGFLRSNAPLRTPIVLAALLRFAALASAYALTGTNVLTQGDTASYLEPGRNLVFHGVFAVNGLAEIDRTPGYPLFAMLAGMAFGNVLLAAAVQILLSLGSLLLVAKIADRIFPNRRAGPLAAWLYAIEPLSVLYAVRLMPETLFVFLLLAAVERLLAFQLTARLRDLAVAGTMLAAATYVRPAAWYLGFALAIGLAVTSRRRRWRAPAVLLLSLLPWLAAWQIRNYVETGYNGFSSIVEKNLYFFQSAGVTAELQQTSLASEQDRLGYRDESAYLALHPEQRAQTRAERLHFMRVQSMRILAQHPGLYLRSHLKGVAVVALTPCATEWLQLLGAYPSGDEMPHRILNEGVFASIRRTVSSHPAVALMMALLEAFLLAVWVLAVRGLALPGIDRLAATTLSGVALYFLLVSGGAQAVGRYRLPVMPFVCIFAAGGLAASRANEKRGHCGPASVQAARI